MKDGVLVGSDLLRFCRCCTLEGRSEEDGKKDSHFFPLL